MVKVKSITVSEMQKTIRWNKLSDIAKERGNEERDPRASPSVHLEEGTPVLPVLSVSYAGPATPAWCQQGTPSLKLAFGT